MTEATALESVSPTMPNMTGWLVSTLLFHLVVELKIQTYNGTYFYLVGYRDLLKASLGHGNTIGQG
jgi:hypothetical protein